MEPSDWSGERLLIPPEDWLEMLRCEYLAEYIKCGGSAVKVVSGRPEVLQTVRARVRETALAEGYYFADVDAGRLDAEGKKPDLHRIERLFFAVTRDVQWKAWTAEQARRHLESHGVMVKEGRLLSDVDGIAADNGREPKDLINEFQREFATPQLRDPGMAIEFRAAVTALGRAQLLPDAVTPTTEEVLLAWLAGRTMPGAAAALKKIHVFERITKSNARHMLASFGRWVPKAGHGGLVVVLDVRAYEHRKVSKAKRQADTLKAVSAAIARRASSDELAALVAEGEAEPAVTYSEAAYLQMLALLRRFIDDIDWFESFLVVVLTTPSFYDSQPNRRNYYDYDALQTRIGLEVHDALRANPAAALVHLGDAP
ncbi:MAG: DUF2791 family P-loop domain-containing protein [Deltaproteobacteria bacterium]|nr:DUF2791 family P-loop domain-containing protein [Deltaproteobacteria bacterium]